MGKLAIVDYGAGNLGSVLKIFDLIGEDAKIVSTPEQILHADRIVLPGVGAAGEALKRLQNTGMTEALNEVVRKKGRPFLGICLGMQMIAERLTEFGDYSGLGWVKGEVIHLNQLVVSGSRVPHMGWSRVEVSDLNNSLFDFVRGKREFYFSHSYAFSVKDSQKVVAITSDYDVPIVAAIISENIFATQFHPEKSQLNGEKLLLGFLKWRP